MTTSGEIVIKEVSGITRVLEYEMQSEFLSHPTARLVCEIEKDFNTRVFLNSDTMFHIEQRESHENLFTGYVDEVSIEERQKDYFILSLIVKAGSVLLDKKVHYRSYQEVSAMHADIIHKVAEEIPQVFVKSFVEEDRVIEKPLIQYGETNWEFIKRVASKRTEPVFVDEAEVEPKVYVGHLAGGSSDEFAGRCIGEGMSDRYYQMGDFSMGYGKSAYYYYKASSEKSYRVGQQVNFQNGKFYIFAKEAKLVQEEIQYTYKLVRDSYLRVPVSYNIQFAGATILGKIEETSGETMKLKLQLKDEKDSSVLYAYDWKPEVGNLMYCMPQKGTTVSLYFPSNNEQEAYAINCIRKSGGRIFESSAKTFLTEDSKFMVMAPEAMHFCAVPKQPNIYSQLSIVDDMEMVLASSGGISLTTSKGIAMSGPTIDLFSSGKAAFGVGTVVEGQEKISWMIDNFTATLEVSPALLNVYAETVTRFLIFGAVDGECYPVIMDVPEKSEVAVGALIRNAVIGVLVTAAVAAACVFALPAVLGAVGVAAGTASTIMMGATVGAVATGVFAIGEQTINDINRGEVTSAGETFLDMTFKTVTGAVEGAVTALMGGGTILQEGVEILSKQTLKNLGMNLLTNQVGSLITKSGEVLLDGLKILVMDEHYYDLEDVGNAYWEGVKDGLFSSCFDLSCAGFDLIKKTSAVKEMKENAGEVLDGFFGEQKWYQTITGGLETLSNVGEKYGDIDESAEKIGKKSAQNDVMSNTAKRAEGKITDYFDEADSAQEIVDRAQDTLDNWISEEAATRAALENGQGDVANLRGYLKYLKNQIKYQNNRIATAQIEVEEFMQRVARKTALVEELTEKIRDNINEMGEIQWKTIAVCTWIKLYQDVFKEGEKWIIEEVKKEI